MAVVYNPATDELYFAEKGCGAFKEGFRNHERLRVSARKELPSALTAASAGLPNFRLSSRCWRLCCTIREACGLAGSLSLDLAYVAAGKLDAAVGLQSARSELLAGMLLVKEAGGLIRDLHARDIRSENLPEVLASGNIMALNPNLNTVLHDLLNK